MKVIIAGSRGITDIELINLAVLHANMQITEVVSGTANGVDKLGEEWAKARKIPVKQFHAKWEIRTVVNNQIITSKDRYAGFKRNMQMALYADALIACWDGCSNGTANMIETMRKMNKPVYVFNIQKDEE